MMEKDQSFKRLLFNPGETIFDEGDTGLVAYMISFGKVKLTRGVGGSKSHTLAEVGAGETIGELALFDDRPRMAKAVAMTATEVIEIAYDEFHKHLGVMDPIMKGIVLLMIKRVRHFTDEVIENKSDRKIPPHA